MDLNLGLTVDTEELAFTLSKALNYDQLIQFIADIDSELVDWEFTEKLYEWASSQHDIFMGEKNEWS